MNIPHPCTDSHDIYKAFDRCSFVHQTGKQNKTKKSCLFFQGDNKVTWPLWVLL